MKTSESITNVGKALAAAQAEIRSIGKDRTNPHFRNTYATLDAIMETVRPVLAKHGLSIIQGMTVPHTDEHGAVRSFVLETMLLHASGEYISNAAVMPVTKADAQGVGSAITYGRRYGVSALLALATDEDDDGHAGSQGNGQKAAPRSKPAAMPTGDGEPPSEKQVGFLHKLLRSSVFTDEERRRIEAGASSKDRVSKAIEWAQEQIDKRKEAA